MFMLQETWIPQDLRLIVDDHLFLFHVVAPPEGSRPRGGVGFVLSPRAWNLWHAAGNPDPILGGSIGGTARAMALILQIPSTRFRRFRPLILLNVYCPHTGLDPALVELMPGVVDNMLQPYRFSHYVILGGDFNALIGSRRSPCVFDCSLLGPNSPSLQNEQGFMWCEFASQHRLRHASSFFQHRLYHTSYSHATQHCLQIDHFFVDKLCRRYGGGVPSDHFAMLLNIPIPAMRRHRRTTRRCRLRTFVDWSRLQDPAVTARFQERVSSLLPGLDASVTVEMADQLSGAMLSAARAELTAPCATQQSWFDDAAATILPLVATCNYLYHKHSRRPTPVSSIQLQDARRKLRKAVRVAKQKWLVHQVQNIIVAPDLKQRWHLMSAFVAPDDQHVSAAPTHAFLNADGVAPTSPAELAANMQQHFSRIYNRNVAIDLSAVDELPQFPMLHQLGNVPTLDEACTAIAKLRNDAAPGDSGLSPCALKFLPDTGVVLLHKCVVSFWNGVPTPKS